MNFALAVHGGAGLDKPGSLTPERQAACRATLEEALRTGARVLAAGGSAVEAVEAAVVLLEDSPLFNAGKGAVLNADGVVEMDAAIMDGRERKAGAVCGVRLVRNPILAARAVMEHSPHVLLCGDGAEAFARLREVAMAEPAYFIVQDRVDQLLRLQTGEPDEAAPDVYGTVGAVARDLEGHLAAATSTGGTVGKHAGRVGDTPIIGAGTFAWDATVAVSATGDGESFIRSHVAGRLSDWMEMAGLSLRESAHRVIHQDLVGGRGGLIAIGRNGPAIMPFNTAGMFRGRMDARGEPEILIW